MMLWLYKFTYLATDSVVASEAEWTQSTDIDVNMHCKLRHISVNTTAFNVRIALIPSRNAPARRKFEWQYNGNDGKVGWNAAQPQTKRHGIRRSPTSAAKWS